MAVTTPLKISDKNAESIGRPIFDKIIRSFLNADRAEFIRHFPYLADWMAVEIFDEAVEVLGRLGELLSISYSSHSIENDKHVLVWEVYFRSDENIVNWNLLLDDNHDEIMVTGFRFDR